jgi:hypothetical protein
MSKALILTHKQWEDALKKIKSTNPPSVYLIRDRMRDVLGFTTRDHEEWIVTHADSKAVSLSSSPLGIDLDLDMLFPHSGKTLRRTVHLDFYDESKKTMFLLKYM